MNNIAILCKSDNRMGEFEFNLYSYICDAQIIQKNQGCNILNIGEIIVYLLNNYYVRDREMDDLFNIKHKNKEKYTYYVYKTIAKKIENNIENDNFLIRCIYKRGDTVYVLLRSFENIIYDEIYDRDNNIKIITYLIGNNYVRDKKREDEFRNIKLLEENNIINIFGKNTYEGMEKRLDRLEAKLYEPITGLGYKIAEKDFNVKKDFFNNIDP